MNKISSEFDLTNRMSAMCLDTRETGLLNIVPMRWYSSQCPIAPQFNSIYASRLNKMAYSFGDIGGLKVDPISQISEDNYTYCVRGIVKRLQTERVRAFEKGFESKYASQKPIYSKDDELEIEDQTGKIKLHISRQTIGNLMNSQITQKDLPSGVCLTISGIFKKRINKFIAKQVFLPQIRMPRQISMNLAGKSVLVASEPSQELCYRIRDIILNGVSPSLGITAVVLVGGCKMTVQEIRWLGQFVSDISQKVDVFIQPSSGEERNRLFPLKPYSKFFFLKQHNEIGLCSNPQLFQAKNGLNMHITCGQNVKDLIKNSAMAKDELDAMEMMIRFKHYCPTAPFSLKTEPFVEDYLIAEETPNVMISGKASKLDNRAIKVGDGQVLLVSIPQNRMAVVCIDGSSVKGLR